MNTLVVTSDQSLACPGVLKRMDILELRGFIIWTYDVKLQVSVAFGVGCRGSIFREDREISYGLSSILYYTGDSSKSFHEQLFQSSKSLRYFFFGGWGIFALDRRPLCWGTHSFSVSGWATLVAEEGRGETSRIWSTPVVWSLKTRDWFSSMYAASLEPHLVFIRRLERRRTQRWGHY